MRIGTVTTPAAVRSTVRPEALQNLAPVQRITPDHVHEDPLDELTQSDRALIAHLYGPVLDLDELEGTPVAQLAAEINRERSSGAVPAGRDLTVDDVRRLIGRLTLTSPRPVPVDVQLRLMTYLGGGRAAGVDQPRLDVVL
ncbi:hypothetical protein [Kineococcus indalonis]|uniref:hypothetical protein n=1 Tax=Kineococcus indalonis TaxID=2696566 RepID=UPI001411FE1D|nr:hypothetical protein [Kineococcus indalonis]NAZ86853.1 hypothetical protein [Kineococcus indalonis]